MHAEELDVLNSAVLQLLILTLDDTLVAQEFVATLHLAPAVFRRTPIEPLGRVSGYSQLLEGMGGHLLRHHLLNAVHWAARVRRLAVELLPLLVVGGAIFGKFDFVSAKGVKVLLLLRLTTSLTPSLNLLLGPVLVVRHRFAIEFRVL